MLLLTTTKRKSVIMASTRWREVAAVLRDPKSRHDTRAFVFFVLFNAT